MSYRDKFDDTTDVIDIEAAAFQPRERLDFLLNLRDYLEGRVAALKDEYGFSEGWE